MFGWKNKTRSLSRRSAEMSGAYDSGLVKQTHGLMAGTKVASNLGWRVIEALMVGDSVLTFDHGMQVITDIRRQTFWLNAPETEAGDWPVIVPVGALENRVPLTLLSDQGVLIESDAAADMFDNPVLIVPVQALVGVRGITRQAPAQPIELITVYFAQEQVIFAEGSALIHCPARSQSLGHFASSDVSYKALSLADAKCVAECLVVEDQMLVAAVG